MFKTVITIIGNSLNLNHVRRIVKSQAVDSLDLSILKDGYAVDVFIKEDSSELISNLYKELSSLGKFDIFIQNNDSFRKKKLLVTDMDATIIRNETLNDIAKEFDLADKIIPITEKSMRGELDFAEALKVKVALLEGFTFERLLSFVDMLEYSSGSKSLIKAMNNNGAKTILVSGGFDIFTSHVASSLGFYKNFGNSLEVLDGSLTGNVISPILDQSAKEKILTDEAKELGIDLKHVMAVGDGANDISMIKKAGTGVGYFAKPLVVESTPYQIRYTDLTSLLYMQGYRQSEIL